MSVHDQNKAFFEPFRRALYDFDEAALQSALDTLFATDAKVHLSHPFETLSRAQSILSRFSLHLYLAKVVY